MDLQKKLKLFRVDSIHKWEEKLKQVSPTGREETVSEINREPVPEDKIRETHAHRGTSIVERGSGNARHRAQGGGARLNILQTKRARRRSTSRERKEKKKDRRKDSRNRRTYLPAEDETVTSVVHGN